MSTPSPHADPGRRAVAGRRTYRLIDPGGARLAGSPFLTEISKADGSELKVCAWLKRISCVEVTCESRPRWQPPMEAFHVRKVCGEAWKALVVGVDGHAA